MKKRNPILITEMKTFLVIRLSSMGDVLLTLPVMRGVLDSHPAVEILFVTNRRFAPYFEGICRLTVLPFEPDGAHSGIMGIFRLYRQISRLTNISAVVDLHGVLRAWLLDLLFMCSLRRVHRIRKYRRRKRDILVKRDLHWLPHTVIRYINVFKKAGIGGHVHPVPFSHIPGFEKPLPHPRKPVRVGIAPISRHPTKNWGLENTARLIGMIKEKSEAEIHLFGGQDERSLLQTLTGENIFNQAGRLDPVDELNLIRSMHVFVTMDSANMHLASMAGIPTISIWGGTHPGLGFSPLNQPKNHMIQVPLSEVKCRPCSVFGEKPCHLADDPMRCMKLIQPGQVYQKITEILGR